MTNETTSTATAVLSLIAAFEAERKAADERIERLEAEVASLHRMIAMDAERMDRIEGRIDVGNKLRDWLDTRFEQEASGVSARLTALEDTLGTDWTASATQRIEARMSEIELAAERLDSRIDYLENQNSNDDEAIREAVERVLDGASLSISI